MRTRICAACLEKLSPYQGFSCSQCGRPLGSETDDCGECLLEPPLFVRHVSYGLYRDQLRELILRYKYGQVEPLKHILADFLLRTWQEKVNTPVDYVIPVPRDRGRKREFDHILKMANTFAARLEVPVLKKHLMKTKKTLPQASLSRSLRLKNLDGAFLFKQSNISLTGKTVLLVDDVYTTGTTIKTCSRVLTQQGFTVYAATAARSV